MSWCALNSKDTSRETDLNICLFRHFFGRDIDNILIYLVFHILPNLVLSGSFDFIFSLVSIFFHHRHLFRISHGLVLFEMVCRFLVSGSNDFFVFSQLVSR